MLSGGKMAFRWTSALSRHHNSSRNITNLKTKTYIVTSSIYFAGKSPLVKSQLILVPRAAQRY